jgi:hypothetical protein
VRLLSDDGTTASLQPVGYQFDRPGGAAVIGTDCDDEWLMLRGDMRTADGRAWGFTDPCLTTWEAAALAGWLRAVASQDARATIEPMLFTEPNLAFLPGACDGEHASIQVRFSYESLPGWLPRDVRGWQAAEYLLPLDVSRRDLAEAAEAWDRECRQFPQRF